MYGKDILIDDGCDGKEIEKICELFPDDSVSIFILAFHIKSIVLRDGSELVVSSDEEYFIWKFKFKKAQQGDSLYAVGSSIDVVS